MPDTTLILSIACGVGLFTTLCVVDWFTPHKRNRLLPPGPKRLPVIGNALQMPEHNNWLTFTEWGKYYGDVVYIRVFGKEVVILNSREAVEDLMVQRSAQYSDRPQRVMARLCGHYRGLLFAPYGERWRKLRRLVHDHVSGQNATRYQSLQEAEAHAFLMKLLDSPERFSQHIRSFAGSLILKMTYGYSVTGENDAMVNLAEEVVKNISEVMTHGAFMVEALPTRRFLRTADKWRQNLEDLFNLPHEFAKRNIERGESIECFSSKTMDKDQPVTEEEEELIRAASASLYAGGADTAVSIIASFFLAMVLHPEIQRKAQEEIERAVGKQRLPRLSDRASLPYVESIAQECLRWHPVTPLVTHATAADDMYKGYLIPAGSAVVANIWAITHDETLYPEPHQFCPERFFEKDADSEQNPLPDNFAFGFGRRGCPGQDVAMAGLWITLAVTLAAFNISPAKNADGEDIIPPVEYTSRSFSHPKPFPCTISPRDLGLLRDL
ncbi:cytochrome P450 [Ramaria rubella]|nr:cytochrome P450 [Ramaria rubella]